MESGMILPVDDYYRKYNWDLKKVAWNCSRCSNCKWVDAWEVRDARFARICPSSQFYLFDAYSCQGRMDTALALTTGKLKYEDSPAIPDIFNKCNLCGGCDAMCKRVQDMEPLRVIGEMRTRLVGDGQISPLHMPVIESLKKEDNMMMAKKADRGAWAEGLEVKDLTRESAEVVFHAGCRLSYDPELRHLPRLAISILKKAGVDFGIMGKDETCCGGRAQEMGYLGEFTKYAENNIEAWKNAGVKTVVTACADGYYTFKRLYPALRANFEVCHIVEYLSRLLETGRLKLTKAVPMTITYHDPCHLGRRLAQAPGHYVPGAPISGLYEEPRRLIKQIPGVRLTEMWRIKEYAWCCGAGGGVVDAYPDFNEFTAGERLAEARATGAAAIVTACPWCEHNFLDAAKASGDKIEVLDILEMVARAL
jgi:Fe-S oxidoreductase